NYLQKSELSSRLENSLELLDGQWLKVIRQHAAKKSRDDPVEMARRNRLHGSYILLAKLEVTHGLGSSFCCAAKHRGTQIDAGHGCFTVVVRQIPPGTDPSFQYVSSNFLKQAGPPMTILKFPREIQNIVKPRRDVVLGL